MNRYNTNLIPYEAPEAELFEISLNRTILGGSPGGPNSDGNQTFIDEGEETP